MAAIEKICEYSGNYTGWPMYRFKRNHIQVEPRYRKHFRGRAAVLTIKKTGISLMCKGQNGLKYLSLFYDWEEEREFYHDRYYDVPSDKNNFEKWMKNNFKKAPVAKYEYVLTITDDTWQCPTMKSSFVEFTHDNPKHVIRRIRRLVGTKNLSIVKEY